MLLPSDVHALFARPFTDRVAAAALALLPGVGPVRWRALLTRHDGDGARAAAALGVTTAAWTGVLRTARERLEACAAGVTVLVAGDAAYPRGLLDLPDAPPVLWVAGNLTALTTTPCVAIVGTRDNTAAGAHTTRRLVLALREAGASVVSGMARGIDGAAHDAALAAGLPTIAVLATGVDVPYPAQHRALHARIVATGAVVSEHPLGTAALPGAFPRRNRIIAALAACTVVVEAGERSGALITADVALDLGRTVAAVPGPIEALASRGTNALLRDGAHVLASVDDLLPLVGARTAPATPLSDESLAPTTRARSPRSSTSSSATSASRPSREPRAPVAPPTDLAADELTLWHALDEPALDADAVGVRAGLTARRCAAALAGLELRGAVTTELTGTIRRL